MQWVVRKHSGKRSSNWRTLFVSPCEEHATTCFEKRAAELMQGTVQLIDPRGNVTAVESIPRLNEILNGAKAPPPRWWNRLRQAFAPEVGV